MDITISSIKVIRSSDSHIRIALRQDGTQYTEYETFFCVSKIEWPMVRACIMGFAEVYPFFDDGLYLMKFTPQGMRVVHTSGNKDDLYFTFPANELVDFIDYQFSYDGDWRTDPYFRESMDYTPLIEAWKAEYGPNIIDHTEKEVKERLANDIVHPMLKEPGMNLVERLTRWASNYSNGNPISINVSFDDTYNMKCHPEEPTSYYWYIWDEDQHVRIVNGGYIAHRYEQKDGSVLFSYSMHT